MVQKNLLIVITLLISGCAVTPDVPESLPSAVFEVEEDEEFETMVTVKYNACPISIVLNDLFSSRNFDYIIPSSFENDKLITGDFKDRTFEDVLYNVCSDAGLFFYRLNNLYVVRGTDAPSLLLVHDSKNDEVAKLFSVAVEKESAVSNVPGYVCFSGRYDVLQRLYANYQRLKNDSKRQFYLEVWLVQSSLESSLNLEANLRFNGYDILKGVNSINDILSCYLSADGKQEAVKISDYQSIYITENTSGVFKIGTNLVREMRSISPEGYANTSGFQTFADGLELNTLVYTFEKNCYALNVDLKSSRYRSSSSVSDVVPPNDTTEIKNSRLVCNNNKVYLLAQLQRSLEGSSLGFVSAGRNNSNMIISVFCRVRFIER